MPETGGHRSCSQAILHHLVGAAGQLTTIQACAASMHTPASVYPSDVEALTLPICRCWGMPAELHLPTGVHAQRAAMQAAAALQVQSAACCLQGDTLSDVATSHGTSLAAVEAANPSISNPDMIQVRVTQQKGASKIQPCSTGSRGGAWLACQPCFQGPSPPLSHTFLAQVGQGVHNPSSSCSPAAAPGAEAPGPDAQTPGLLVQPPISLAPAAAVGECTPRLAVMQPHVWSSGADTLARAGNCRAEHAVVQGETLSTIAAQYSVDLSALEVR